MADDAPIEVVDTREGYDRWAHLYDIDCNPLIALEERYFPEILGEVCGLAIADFECGTGRHAARLAREGAAMTALDFSTGMSRFFCCCGSRLEQLFSPIKTLYIDSAVALARLK